MPASAEISERRLANGDDLDPLHHVFRHVKSTAIDGDFVDPSSYRLRKEDDGNYEVGLSTNWVEYFGKATPEEAVAPLREILKKKGRTVRPNSKFVLFNVGRLKTAAAQYTPVRVIFDEEDSDKAHTLVTGYSAFNEQVAEAFSNLVDVDKHGVAGD